MATDQDDTFLQALVGGSPVARPLARGEVVAERFVIEDLVGTGGMGAVYRAVDRASGATVAVKILRGRGGDRERFEQEARVLAELSYPAVVRYVAHGPLGAEQRFLAMEWLEGEDLAKRLERGALSARDAVAIARRAAEGLAFAHARGIVHRDVKPSNLFLVGGEPEQTKVLDFGVARLAARAHAMTKTGAIIGTVGYMAPEQATAERDIDARADVFALGCVLFECLTGQPAFAAEHVVAILAKVLREDVPRVSTFVPDVPAALDDLVARMLAKPRDERPVDARAVIAELDRLESVSATMTVPARLTSGERRLVCVLLVDGVRELAASHGAEVARLANSSYLVTPAVSGTPTDQAAHIAQVALAVRDAHPDARLALAMGRTETTGRQLVGPTIDRAAAALDGPSGQIRIDSVTASLLDARFELRGGVLVGRREIDEVRTLMGKRTPCVGRDKELALLDATLAECIDEPVARAVLVTAPPGAGKSRLRLEFVSRVDDRVHVIVARADPVGAGSSLGLVRQLVRAAAGLREGDPADVQRARLTELLARDFRGDELARTSDFLGELVGAPTQTPCAELRAARLEPAIMSAWIRRTFDAWIAAECATRPTLVVIEDLHWGDAASVAFLDGALHALRERPLFVLALARPEVHDVFPKLWSGVGTQEIRLGPLTRRAAERLIGAALGDSLAPDRVARIVERADGNAYYLEELIRCVAEEGTDELPDTILAMVQSRLDRIEPEARRLVRAASVFGEVLWLGGVSALVGGVGDREVASWLQVLADREILTARASAKFPGETEYSFRHGLLREAAYATLTTEDRTVAHKLAGEWLERAGEKDAFVLADHFELGGDAQRAVPWLLAAAKAAYDGSQFEDAIELCKRGIATGATGEIVGLFRRIQGSSAALFGDWRLMREWTSAAIASLPQGSDLWVRAVGGRAISHCHLGDAAAAVADIERLAEMDPDPAPTTHGAWGLMLGVYHALYLARPDLTEVLLARFERMKHDPRAADEPAFAVYLTLARTVSAWVGLREPVGSDEVSVNIATSRRLGDFNGEFAAMTFAATLHAELGDRAALAQLDLARGVATRARTPHYFSHASFFGARACAFHGRLDDAVREAGHAGDWFFTAAVRGIIGWAHVERGELAAAEREARAALEIAKIPFFEAIPLAVLARYELLCGRSEAAIALADRGIALVEALGRLNEMSLLRLVRAEALHASGNGDGARAEIAAACARIQEIAATIDSPARRESYVTNIAPNARTLELARRWGVA